MTPYYQDDACTIYHGDCREVLPQLPKAHLLLTDPPYGLTHARKKQRPGGTDLISTDMAKRRFSHNDKAHPPVAGDDEAFDPQHLLGAARRHVIFGANWFASRLPDASCWLVWDKRRGGTFAQGWKTADAELAWTDLPGGVRVFQHLWCGFYRDSERGYSVHPTQKPVALMSWIIEKWTKPGDLIIDPYMGSGSVLRAAKNLGRKAIGVELQEDYCAIVVERLAQEVLAI